MPDPAQMFIRSNPQTNLEGKTMQKTTRLIIFLCLLVISITLTSAQGQETQKTTTLYLREAETGRPFIGVLSNVLLDETRITFFTEQDGSITIPIIRQPKRGMVYVDNLSTTGTDYFATFALQEGQAAQTVALFPAGSIRGLVKDRLENVVPNASLEIDCAGMSLLAPKQTDQFGAFSVIAAPVGVCRLFARYHEGVGVADISIVQGEVTNIDVLLDKSIGFDEKKVPVWGWVLIVAALAAALYFALRYLQQRRGIRKDKGRMTSEEKKEEHKETTPEREAARSSQDKETGKRARDILNTLPATEKGIVEYLLQHNNEASQAAIRHATGVPRTTLARCLIALEKKKVVLVEKWGKIVKVRLTNWFLE